MNNLRKAKFSKRNTRQDYLLKSTKNKSNSRISKSQHKISNITETTFSPSKSYYQAQKRSLTIDQLDEQYKIYSEKIQAKYLALQAKYPKKNFDPEKNNDLKRCEECKDFVNEHKLILCDICNDAFHTYCLVPAMKKLPPEDESFYCKYCQEQFPNRKNKEIQSRIEDKFQLSKISKQKVKF